jgi:hypothetical protein
VSSPESPQRFVTPVRASRLIAGVAFATALFSCSASRPVEIRVALADSVDSSDVKYIEVGAFPSASCAALRATLSGGIPEGSARRYVWSPGDTPPSVVDLPPGRVAFAALAKSEGCGVLAFGCTDVEVARATTEVSIPTSSSDDPGRGTCARGAACERARCVSRELERACSLTLVASGPLAPKLPRPDSDAPVNVPSPAIVASGDHFVLSYAEFTPGDGITPTLWSTTQALAPRGAALPADHQLLSGRCATLVQDDAVGLAGTGQGGLSILARNPCASGSSGADSGAAPRSGIDARFLGDDGLAVQGGYSILGQDLERVSLSHAKALAAGSKPNTFYGAARFASGVGLFRFEYANDVRFGTPKAVSFPGTYSQAWLASSSSAVAMAALAGSAGAIASRLSLFAWPRATVPTESTYTKPALRTLDEVRWASPVLLDSTLWLATGDTLGTRLRSFEFVAGELASRELLDVNPLAPSSLGDLAAVRYPSKAGAASARVFVATAEEGDIALRAFNVEGAQASLTQSVSLRALGTVLQAGARDGQVAVAATTDHVALVWATARTLRRDEPLGGYAMFSCIQE